MTITLKTDSSATEMQNRERSRVTECGCWAALSPWGTPQCPSDREKYFLKHLATVKELSQRSIILHVDKSGSSSCCQVLCLISLSGDAFDSWFRVLAQYDDALYDPESILKHESSTQLSDEQVGQEIHTRTEGSSSFKDCLLGVPVAVATKQLDEDEVMSKASESEGSTEFNESGFEVQLTD
jgi:hypothetical protein